MPKTEPNPSNGSYNYAESPTVPHSPEHPGSVEIVQSDADTRLQPSAIPEVCKELNVASLSGNAVRELAMIGVAVESNGSVQVGSGAVMVTELLLIEIAIRIRDAVRADPTPATAIKVQKAACEIAREVVKMGGYWKTRVATTSKAAPGPTREEAFNPDEPVRSMNLTQINIHESK